MGDNKRSIVVCWRGGQALPDKFKQSLTSHACYLLFGTTKNIKDVRLKHNGAERIAWADIMHHHEASGVYVDE